jgi:uncharacterized protein with HEPN domain
VSFRDARQPLEDILENIARIERFVGGLDEPGFRQDEQARFAVQYALLVISEAARRLGAQAEGLCPDIPWAQIRGIGNRLRHGYDTIDPAVLWQTVQKDLGPLRLSTMLALNRLEGPEAERG